MLYQGLEMTTPKCAWRWVMLALIFSLGGCAGVGTSTSDRPASAEQVEGDHRAQVRLELAAAYFGRGQMDTALEEIKQALSVRPNMSSAYNLRGLVLASQGEARLADESFRRAQQLDPGDGDVAHNHGWFLCQSGRFDEASIEFKRALAQPRYRDPARTLMTMGICQARSGQLPEAEKLLMKAYELDPTSPITAVNLAEVLYRRGEFERARFYVRRVNTVSDFANAQSLWLATRVENRLTNRSGVREFGEQLRSRFPESPEALLLDRGRFDD
jgi:type IV pilus assembly protein PilF